MLTFLGITCVAWTTFEVHRILAGTDAATTSASPSFRPVDPAPRRFSAWDDRGRPICVEDLGRAA